MGLLVKGSPPLFEDRVFTALCALDTPRARATKDSDTGEQTADGAALERKGNIGSSSKLISSPVSIQCSWGYMKECQMPL